MKKSKLFILLPLVALTLTGCNNTIVSETTSEAPQESETTKVNGYSSYTLEFSFYYSGVKESLPSGSTIYYAGETNNWSFTPLKESDESFILDVGPVEYKTYEYKLLIEYDDKTVSWDNEKVVWPTPGEAKNASFTVRETDGGSQSVTCSLSSSLEDILTSEEENTGENSSETTTSDTTEGSSSESSSGSGSGYPGEPGTGGSSSSSENPGTGESSSGDSSSGDGQGGDLGGSETFTYSIELNNADALQAMEYDAALTEQKGVDLDISLVTTSSTGEVTKEAATVDKVQFELKGSAIIHFADLTVYPDASGETSFTISWPETTATPISVSVKITDVTQEVVTSLSNYTLRFNFTYEENQETVPEGTELRILGSWDNDDNTTWSNYHVLTAEQDGSYTYTIDQIDVLTDDDAWYTYTLVLGYPDEEYITWDYELTFVEGTYLTFGVTGEEGDNHTNNIALALSAPMSSIISDLISEYVLTVTITYNGTAETLPSWADLYINGTWANSDELGWNNFEQLTPNEDRTEFTVTIKDVHPGYYNYDLVMVQAGETPASDWSNTHRITPEGSNGYFEIAKGTVSGSTSYDSETALAEIYGDPAAETSYTNHVISITLKDTSGNAISVPTWVSVYAEFNFDSWELHQLTRTSDSTFTYTVPSITSGSYSYSIDVEYTDAELQWNDHQLANGVAFDIAKDDDDNQTDIVLTTSFDFATNFPEIGDTGSGNDYGGRPGATYATDFTLIITFYDSTGTTVKVAPTGYNLYIQANIDGTWTVDESGDEYYSYGNMHQLEETADNEGNTAYKATFEYAEVGSEVWHNYDIYYATSMEAINWESSKVVSYYYQVDTNASDNYTQYTTCPISSSFDDIFPNASGDTGDTGDQGQGGNEGSLNDDGTATVTLDIVMYASDGTTSLSVPGGCKVYIVGDFDITTEGGNTWWTLDGNSAIQLTSTDGGTYLYTYTISVTPGNNYQFKLLLVEDNATYDWYTYVIYDSTFSVPAETQNGDSISLNCMTTYTSLSDALVDDEGDDDDNDETYEGSVTVYFLIIDTTTATDKSALDWCFNFTYDVENGTDGIFKTNGDNSSPDPWYNWSNASGITGTVNGTTHVGVYNYTPGEMETGGEVWMNLKNWTKSETAWQSYYFDCVVPTNCGSVVTFVGYADLTAFNTSLSTTFSNEVTMTAYAGTPETVFALL